MSEEHDAPSEAPAAEPEFAPLVQLPEVDAKTNEEHETVLLRQRAKLYRFDRSADPAEWKERGTGELKVLRNDANAAVRVVMRRDKTYKVCANHFVTPWLGLKAYFGSEKAFLYTVPADFADEMPKQECFVVKFVSVEEKNAFGAVIETAKRDLLVNCCLYNGECDKEEESEGEEEEEDEKVEEKLKGLKLSVSEDDQAVSEEK